MDSERILRVINIICYTDRRVRVTTVREQYDSTDTKNGRNASLPICSKLCLNKLKIRVSSGKHHNGDEYQLP